MKDETRKTFLQQMAPVAGKVKRPDPTETDALGNRLVKAKSAKKSMTVWLEPETIKQFKILAAEQDVEIQELMAEAMNLAFAKHGKPQIA